MAIPSATCDRAVYAKRAHEKLEIWIRNAPLSADVGSADTGPTALAANPPMLSMLSPTVADMDETASDTFCHAPACGAAMSSAWASPSCDVEPKRPLSEPTTGAAAALSLPRPAVACAWR